MSRVLPLISVVIPTFNRAQLVGHAIESVLMQTYGQIEVVVVDDGSTDDTATVLRSYKKRLRWIRQDNRGVSGARNTGISAATGDWIAMLDSDDTWHVTKLDVQMAALSSLGREAGGCFTDVRFVGGPGLEETAFSRAGYPACAGPQWVADPLHWLLTPYPALFLPSLLMRRSLMEGLHGFDLTLGTSEDTDFVFRLALQTRLCTVPEPLVNVDNRPDRNDKLSRLVVRDVRRNFQVQDQVLSKWLQILAESAPEGWRSRVHAALVNRRYHELRYCLKHGQLADALRVAKALRTLDETPADLVRAVLGRAIARLP